MLRKRVGGRVIKNLYKQQGASPNILMDNAHLSDMLFFPCTTTIKMYFNIAEIQWRSLTWGRAGGYIKC